MISPQREAATMVLEYSPPAQKGGGPDRTIRMITEGSAKFPRDARRIVGYPGALATTLELGSGTMYYEEGAVKLNPI